MRVALQQHTVHECTRIPLVCVANNVLSFAFSFQACRPLGCRGEPGPAAATQSRPFNLIYNLSRLRLQGPGQACITAAGNIMVDIQRRIIAAVAQQHPRLVIEQFKLRDVYSLITTTRQCAKGQLQAGVIAQNVSFNKLRYHLRSDMMITDGETARLYDDHQRLVGTQSHAAGLRDLCLPPQPVNFAPESLKDGHRAGGTTAGSRAHKDMDNSA